MVDEALEAVKLQFKLRMERLAERQALFEEVGRVLVNTCSMHDTAPSPPPPAEAKGNARHGGQVQALH